MSSHQGKLTSERNQKILLELASQPGNNICADCKARTPRWASANLGIFICVNCASIHRKIGTHITKVKSLTMDEWTKEQVDHMRSMGNVKSNSIYNPNELRHPPPPNLEDANRDSEIEQYIRGKYEYKKFFDRSALVASKLGPSRSAASVVPRSVSQPLAAGQSSTATKPTSTPAYKPSTSSTTPSSALPASKSQPFPSQYPSTLSQNTNPVRSASQPIPPQQPPAAPKPSGGVWDDINALAGGPSQNSSLPLQYQATYTSGTGINPYAAQNTGFNPFSQQQAQFMGGTSPASVTSHMVQSPATTGFYQPQPQMQMQGSLQPSGSLGQASFLSPSPSLLSATGGGNQFLSPSPSLQQQPQQQQFLTPSPSLAQQQFLSASPSQQFLSSSPSFGVNGMSASPAAQQQPPAQFLGMTSMQMQQQLMLQQQAEQQRQQQQQQQQQQLQQQQQIQQLQQQQQLQQLQQQHQLQQQMQQQQLQQQQQQFQQQMQQQQGFQQQLPAGMFAPQQQVQQPMFTSNQMFAGNAGFGAQSGQWGAL